MDIVDYENLLYKFQKKYPEKIDTIKDILSSELSIYEEDYRDIDSLNKDFKECFSENNVDNRWRKKDVVVIKHFFWYLCKFYFKKRYSLSDLGSYNTHNSYNHTTIIHCVRRIKNLIQANDFLVMSLLNKWNEFRAIKYGEKIDLSTVTKIRIPYDRLYDLEHLYNTILKVFPKFTMEGKDKRNIAIKHFFWYLAFTYTDCKYSLKKLQTFKSNGKIYSFSNIKESIQKTSDYIKIKDDLIMEIYDKWQNSILI